MLGAIAHAWTSRPRRDARHGASWKVHVARPRDGENVAAAPRVLRSGVRLEIRGGFPAAPAEYTIIRNSSWQRWDGDVPQSGARADARAGAHWLSLISVRDVEQASSAKVRERWIRDSPADVGAGPRHCHAVFRGPQGAIFGAPTLPRRAAIPSMIRSSTAMSSASTLFTPDAPESRGVLRGSRGIRGGRGSDAGRSRSRWYSRHGRHRARRHHHPQQSAGLAPRVLPYFLVGDVARDDRKRRSGRAERCSSPRASNISTARSPCSPIRMAACSASWIGHEETRARLHAVPAAIVPGCATDGGSSVGVGFYGDWYYGDDTSGTAAAARRRSLPTNIGAHPEHPHRPAAGWRRSSAAGATHRIATAGGAQVNATTRHDVELGAPARSGRALRIDGRRRTAANARQFTIRACAAPSLSVASLLHADFAAPVFAQAPK